MSLSHIADPSESDRCHWLIAQRLLNDVGVLDATKAEQLHCIAAGWPVAATDLEIAIAITVDDAGLNDALEIWWNLSAMPGTPITFAEIRAQVAMEM